MSDFNQQEEEAEEMLQNMEEEAEELSGLMNQEQGLRERIMTIIGEMGGFVEETLMRSDRSKMVVYGGIVDDHLGEHSQPGLLPGKQG